MKIYLADSHSDEDGALATEGKLGILQVTKEDVARLAKFFADASKYLETNDYCHLQFRDSFDDWNKGEHIDIEINVE
ncbi:MAG: hypothetical protein H6602_14540 [Flavobacteriales bacterium]|nr:hypothetical protein [Flavobacteriales bacterium]